MPMEWGKAHAQCNKGKAAGTYQDHPSPGELQVYYPQPQGCPCVAVLVGIRDRWQHKLGVGVAY